MSIPNKFRRPARKRIASACATMLIALLTTGEVVAGGWLQKGKQLLDDLTGEQSAGGTLAAQEIAAGLKEALRVGTEDVVGQLGQIGGFSSDPAVHIPLPDSLARVSLGKVGMRSMLTDLETKLNRAAEVATPKAKTLFWDAIGQMRLEDAQAIYRGPNDAATRYFQRKMSAPLAAEMRPVIADSLSEVGAVQAYDDAIARYRDIPFVPDVKADLTDYVVAEGMDGIFYYLAREEAAIREDPAQRTTELLRRVFGGG